MFSLGYIVIRRMFLAVFLICNSLLLLVQCFFICLDYGLLKVFLLYLLYEVDKGDQVYVDGGCLSRIGSEIEASWLFVF